MPGGRACPCGGRGQEAALSHHMFVDDQCLGLSIRFEHKGLAGGIGGCPSYIVVVASSDQSHVIFRGRTHRFDDAGTRLGPTVRGPSGRGHSSFGNTPPRCSRSRACGVPGLGTAGGSVGGVPLATAKGFLADIRAPHWAKKGHCMARVQSRAMAEAWARYQDWDPPTRRQRQNLSRSRKASKCMTRLIGMHSPPPVVNIPRDRTLEYSS